MIAAAHTIGSAASCGRAPCAPRPASSISKVSADAASDPSERAALQHGGRAFAGLLGRLQHDEHVAGGGRGGEKMRRADRPRRMDVMATGVHHPRVDRREGKPGGLLNRQGIDVSPHGHDGCVAPAALDARDDTGAGDALHAHRPERRQRALEQVRRTGLRERQLRMLVNVATQSDYRVPDRGGHERVHRERGRHRQ